jgi:hypothetical protein
MPAQAATVSTGSVSPSDNGCGAAMVAPITAPAPSRAIFTSTSPAISSNVSTPSRSRPRPAST